MFRLATLAAVSTLPTGVLEAQGMPAQARLNSGSGRPGTVQLTHLGDSDDPAGVIGTHYRVGIAGEPVPPGTTLVIRWTDAELPGGVTGSMIGAVHHDGPEWVAASGARRDADSVVIPVAVGGDYAVRWIPPTTICTDTAHRQLDYRLGHWDYRATGYDPGRSDVTEDHSRCALYDRFVDATGGRSDAFILYNAAEGEWYVTTWDPGGRTIGRGTATRDGIVLMQSATEREVYRRRLDGGIDFSVERSSDGGVTWSSWATGVYTRVHEE